MQEPLKRLRIGRYEVVGRLAVGGMAEILLARLVGPQGFEQPVVIKRILPHLVERPQFLTMLTDEALIAARIQHPNVVRIHELIEHDGLPHIVMEYLPGESLDQVLAALEVRDEGLQLALALHVVAETAGGLHAAHELREPDGTPLGVVHRDVSPHNIFVTDEGEVKVLDFGIVKATSRMTKTATGQLKGKYRYLAPEQCHGKPIDRRADIFALGVVLYEATTGTRLFERANELLTLKAIMMDPIPPPSEIVAGYPKDLEAVVMRAVERDPEQRYRSADELRQALVSVANRITGPVLPDRGLRGRMRHLFRDRIEQRKEMLRRLAEDDTVGLKLVDPREALDHSRSGVIMSRERLLSQTEGEPRKALRGALGVLGAALAATLLVSLGWYARGEPPPRVVAPSAPAPAAPPVVEIVDVEPLLDEVEMDPLHVAVEVFTTPEGATVRWRNGELVGTTPLQKHFEWSDERVALRIELEGYRQRVIELTPDVDQRISLDLVPEPVTEEGSTEDEVEEEPEPEVRVVRSRRRRRQRVRQRRRRTLSMETAAMRARSIPPPPDPESDPAFRVRFM